MAQQTFAGVPAEFTAGEVLSSSDQNLLRNFLIALIKEGQTGDTGEILPIIMDLTNNRIVLDAGGLEFSNGSLQTVAAAGMTWSGSTANGIGTYGSGTSIVAESTATYNGTTLQLTTSGGGLKLDNLASSNANTLDDYEEGTFTPTLIAGTAGTFGLSTAEGTYTKIGRLVNIQGRVIVNSISSGPSPSGDCRIESLPFTPGAAGASSVYVRILSANSTEGFSGVQFAGYARIYIRRNGTTGSGDDWADKVAVGSQIFYSCTYSI